MCAAVVLSLRWLAPRTRGLLREDLGALIPPAGALVAIASGVLGHLIPDGIMHFDVRPLAPFSDANPLYDRLSLTALHAALVICGFAGAVVWLWRHGNSAVRRPRRRSRR